MKRSSFLIRTVFITGIMCLLTVFGTTAFADMQNYPSPHLLDDPQSTITPCDEHTFSEWNILSDATCTENGSRERSCIICGYTESEEIVSEGHIFSEEWSVDTEPSCTVPGEMSHHCIHCEERTDVSEIPATGHSFPEEWITDKDATCTENGSKHRVCTECTEEEQEIIPAKGHTFEEEWTVDKEPSCTEPGLKSHHCAFCDEISDITEIEAFGHDYVCIFDKPATCESSGKRIYVCHNDETHTYEEFLPQLMHIESEWIIDDEPDYSHNGSRHKECILCGKTLRTETLSILSDITSPYGAIIIANNRWTKFSEKINATHYKNQTINITIEGHDNESGLKKTEYFVSSAIVPYSELALESWTEGNAISVEADGQYIIYARLTDNSDNVCYISSDLIVIDTASPIIDGVVDSGIYCKTATFEVTDENLLYVKINGTKAEPNNKGKYSVSAKNGFQSIEVCDSANNILFIVIMVNSEHEFKTLITDRIPTCLDGGAAHYECTHCGAVQYEMLDPYGHETPEEWEITKQPTCEIAGTRIKLCSRCGVLLESEEIPMLSHEYRNGKCIRCGKVYSKDLPLWAIIIGSAIAVLAIVIVVLDRTKKAKNMRAIDRTLAKISRRL